MPRLGVIAALAVFLLAGCDRKENYRQAGNPPGQNPNGAPADRTGGARKAADDGAGGEDRKNTKPADQKK